MKKIKFLAVLFLATSVAMVSCKKDEPTEPVVKDANYVGTISVKQPDATVFSKHDVSVEVKKTAATDTVHLLFKRVKFTDTMPVEVDIIIPVVVSVITNDTFLLSGTEITPLLASGLPFATFQINDIEGSLSDTGVNLFMNVKAVQAMGPSVPAGTIYETTYVGAVAE
jgi:hypothetical protein